MLKKKYIKRAYIEVAICDKCGAELCPTDICYTTLPAKYLYKCSNPDCDERKAFWDYERPGKLCYEFEEDENV